MAGETIRQIGPGVLRVEHDGRAETVYVAGTPQTRWAFWNGHVYREAAAPKPARRRSGSRGHGAQALTAPMPATVVKVMVRPGASVKKGDTLLLLEAMKMELPVRAPADATVSAVLCREGDLVQPDVTLVELA